MKSKRSEGTRWQSVCACMYRCVQNHWIALFKLSKPSMSLKIMALYFPHSKLVSSQGVVIEKKKGRLLLEQFRTTTG